jgi:FkbM family methyltransferase
MNIIYLIIYNRYINFFLRWINKGLSAILPFNFKIPPSGVLQLGSGKNRFKLATNQTSYLTQQLFWHGISSFEYTTIFRSLIKKVDSFFDVGANIGYYTILACTENKNIKVFSFEPAKGACRYLQKNVSLNRLGQQVRIEEFALTDNRQTLTFHEVKNNKYRFTRDVLSGESNAATKNLNREFKTYNVPGITLDEYIDKVLSKGWVIFPGSYSLPKLCRPKWDDPMISVIAKSKIPYGQESEYECEVAPQAAAREARR